jgi:murein DD-endopeptidase MepM/ murein hydrolase activator NlpD
MKGINWIVLIGLWSTASNTAIAAELPDHHPVPGGIAIVAVDTAGQPTPDVRYDNQRVLLMSEDGKRYAVVGIPLSADSGEHYLDVRSGNENLRRLSFRVLPKRYARQDIRLRDKRMVDPGPEELVRIARDGEQIREAFLTWTPESVSSLRLDLPADGRLTARFGLRRYFNDQPRKPHSGIDIAAPLGTVVRAPADATVLKVGDYFFNGNTLFLDHGQGLITMYNHLNRIRVAVGAAVKRGEPVGEIGQTGRVTGPHLHWSVSLNDARIDPLLLTGPLPNDKTAGQH